MEGGSVDGKWPTDKSRQAVEKKFGALAWDLAATDSNAKAPFWITKANDSFEHDWHRLKSDGSLKAVGSKRMADLDDHPLLWLNPEYANITPWAKKCAGESKLGARILMLVPGSIGANWYWDWVEPFADVYSVGRMVFENCYYKEGHRKAGQLITDVYPKDLLLAHYHSNAQRRLTRWRWK